MSLNDNPPVVLVIAGNDPSGGAGICADTQAISALGCHPAPVLSSVTVQDTINAYAVQALEPDFVREQAERVLEDLPVKAIKLGLLGTAEIGAAVAVLLARYPDIPVVTDPVLVAAGGAQLAEDRLIEQYLGALLPRTAVLTPNAFELRRLAPNADDITGHATALLEAGAEWLLAKGGDEATAAVENVLFHRNEKVRRWQWQRLAGEHHGSGCTLASAIAAFIARGHEVPDAVEKAQTYTFHALASGWQLGHGQRIPNRQRGQRDE